jgi:hypothetical protein
LTQTNTESEDKMNRTHIVARIAAAIGLLSVAGLTACKDDVKQPAYQITKTSTYQVIYTAFVDDQGKISQNYGFDGHDPKTIAWKSVEEGQTDKFVVSTLPPSEAPNVVMVSTNTTRMTLATDPVTTPTTLSTSPQTLKVTGVAIGEAKGESHYKTVTGGAADKIGVAVYATKRKTVAIIPVNNTGGPNAE